MIILSIIILLRDVSYQAEIITQPQVSTMLTKSMLILKLTRKKTNGNSSNPFKLHIVTCLWTFLMMRIIDFKSKQIVPHDHKSQVIANESINRWILNSRRFYGLGGNLRLGNIRNWKSSASQHFYVERVWSPFHELCSRGRKRNWKILQKVDEHIKRLNTQNLWS